MKRILCGILFLFLLGPMVFGTAANYEVIDKIDYEEEKEMVIQSDVAGNIFILTDEFSIILYNEHKEQLIRLIELNLKLMNVAESENTTIMYRRFTGSMFSYNDIRIATTFYTSGEGSNVMHVDISTVYANERITLDRSQSETLINALQSAKDQTDEFQRQVELFNDALAGNGED